MNNRETFERAKLQLSRLNGMWSPNGETFNTRAEYELRQAVWNDNGEMHIVHLCVANELLRQSYMEWNDCAPDHSTAVWNQIYAGTGSMIDDLSYDLSRKSKAAIQSLVEYCK